MRNSESFCAATQNSLSIVIIFIFVKHNFGTDLWPVFLQPIQTVPADDQERDRQEEQCRAGGRKPLPRASIGREPTGRREHCPEPSRCDAAEQPGRCANSLRPIKRAPPSHAVFYAHLRPPTYKCQRV